MQTQRDGRRAVRSRPCTGDNTGWQLVKAQARGPPATLAGMILFAASARCEFACSLCHVSVCLQSLLGICFCNLCQVGLLAEPVSLLALYTGRGIACSLCWLWVYLQPSHCMNLLAGVDMPLHLLVVISKHLQTHQRMTQTLLPSCLIPCTPSPPHPVPAHQRCTG
jgi:hypothetical protein